MDVSVRRGLDAVVLEGTNIVEARSALGPRDLRALLEQWQPGAVAIDSPPGPGQEPGASARSGERELRALGVPVFLTPSDADRYAGPFYDWIRVGALAFRAAAEAGFPVQDDPDVVRGCALEVFPHASDAFLRGCLPPLGTTRRVTSKRAWRLATLRAAGIDTESLCSHRLGQPTLDSVDAALAALTARHALGGNFTSLGGAGEWIVVPGTNLTGLARSTPLDRG